MSQELNDLETKINQLEKLLEQKDAKIASLEKLIYYIEESRNRSFNE